MSNVSPQQVRQVIQRSRLVMQRDVARWASDVALVRQRGVACHQMATHRPRANAAEPFANTVDPRSERHGAEAPRKSNSRLSRFVQSRVGERSGRARQLCHLTRRRIKCRVSHCRRRWSTLEQRAMRRNTKCRNDRGSARVTFRMQASQRPTSSPREPSRLRSAPSELGANPSIEGTCNIWLRQLSPAPHVKR